MEIGGLAWSFMRGKLPMPTGRARGAWPPPRRGSPPWVKSTVLTANRSHPVYPDQRTLSVEVGMSERCQLRTLPGLDRIAALKKAKPYRPTAKEDDPELHFESSETSSTLPSSRVGSKEYQGRGRCLV
jgi:hypothetical protein